MVVKLCAILCGCEQVIAEFQAPSSNYVAQAGAMITLEAAVRGVMRKRCLEYSYESP